MKLNRFVLAGMFSLTLTVNAGGKTKNLPAFSYKQANLPVTERVNNLLSLMTLDEKIGQLCCPLGWEMYQKNTSQKVQPSLQFKQLLQKRPIGMFWATLRADPWTQKTLETGLNPQLAAKATNELQKYIIENTRLGIPLFFAEECPHGHMAIGTTVFPTSIGQASTWNPTLIEQMAATVGLEASLQGAHIGYGPILDLAREPRWSRVEETYGEDPMLSAEIGKAMVRGIQKEKEGKKHQMLSTLKHFVAYGVPEGGHNGGSVRMGTRELMTDYMPPFKAAVEQGALSVMTAYNSIDGIACTSNEYLLKKILRDQWNFKGFVVSDLKAIENQAGTQSVLQSASASVNAGVDVDLGGDAYGDNLAEAVKQGKVSIAQIDSAVCRVLRLKFEMGLFDNPYVKPAQAAKLVGSEAHKLLARNVAQQSIVLLKNENKLLPLDKNIRRIAVIGPNADNIYNQLGDYTAPQAREKIITVLDGIKNKVSKQTVVDYVKGCAIRDTTTANIDLAVKAARDADAIVVVLGGSSARDFKTKYIETGAATVATDNKELSDMESGEGFDRSTLDLLGKQLSLLQQLAKTGKPIVLVMIEGRPLNINWAADHIPAIVNAWYPGQEGGNAVADVLFGDYNPAGRLPISIPRSVGQLPVYYSQPIAHNYLEESSKPMYSFGYGLSYTSFKYNNLKTIALNDSKHTVNVEFTVQNTGNFDGDEVVQLYLKDDAATVMTASKLLKRFQRVTLKKGETTVVRFQLNADDMSLYNRQMERVLEPGTFSVMIGSSSDNIHLNSKFNIIE